MSHALMTPRDRVAATFLVVDDDEVAVMAIRRALGKLDIRNPVEVAYDGQEALDRLRTDGDRAVRRPFIILLDLNMPRMSGLEFLAEVREDHELQNSVIFVQTTSEAPDDIVSAYHHKVAGYFVKEHPYNSVKSAIGLLGGYADLVRLPQ